LSITGVIYITPKVNNFSLKNFLMRLDENERSE
jgi:hypothetical protein